MQDLELRGELIKANFSLVTLIFLSLLQQKENVLCRGNSEELR